MRFLPTDMLEDADQNNRNNRNLSKSHQRGRTILRRVNSLFARRSQRKLSNVSEKQPLSPFRTQQNLPRLMFRLLRNNSVWRI